MFAIPIDSTTQSEQAATEDIPATASSVRISWAHVIPSLIGMGLSAYSVYLHHLVKLGGDACSYTETISCNKVLGSNYSEFLHMPLGVFGLVFFLIMIVLSISTQPPSADRATALSRLAVAAGGLVVSITLTAISFAAIHAACPVCLATHTCTLVVFGVSLWQYVKAGRSL